MTTYKDLNFLNRDTNFLNDYYRFKNIVGFDIYDFLELYQAGLVKIDNHKLLVDMVSKYGTGQTISFMQYNQMHKLDCLSIKLSEDQTINLSWFKQLKLKILSKLKIIYPFETDKKSTKNWKGEIKK